MVSATLLSAIALAATATPSNAFAPSSIGNTPRGRLGPLFVTEDASAQALSDYMAKSHEEKLRAVKDVEEKKNSEIEALKAEIQQLKSSSALATTAPAPAAPLANVDSSEMAAKLASYQSFMAEYIVNAQNQKLLAVKEAELKAEKKFQERLAKLFDGMALPEGVAVEPAAVVVEETPFQSRNAQIIAAGQAGKSRWGSMEIERAIEQAKSAPAPVAAAAATSAPPEVEATVFQQRNAQVVAAGAAGKSRWGNMEVERAAAANGATAVAAPVAVKEEKTVASVSLEDRVNLGARLLGA